MAAVSDSKVTFKAGGNSMVFQSKALRRGQQTGYRHTPSYSFE